MTAVGAFSTAFPEMLGDTDLADALRQGFGPAGVLAPSFAARILAYTLPSGRPAAAGYVRGACATDTLFSSALDPAPTRFRHLSAAADETSAGETRSEDIRNTEPLWGLGAPGT